MDWTIDFEHRSTYYLLTNAPALARKFDESEHVSRTGIEWTVLESVCFSGAERLLVRVARDLWNRTGEAPLGDLLVTLDDANFEAFLHAMRLWRRCEPNVSGEGTGAHGVRDGGRCSLQAARPEDVVDRELA